MSYIYRVENKLKEGCYRSIKTREVLKNHWNQSHPPPLNDNGIKRCMNMNEICGFKSIQQAFQWFTIQELLQLKILGYSLKRIKVKEITAIGEYQVLAIR
jgi:hypothetical protein